MSLSPSALRHYVETETLLAKWRLEDDGYRKARGYTFNGHLEEVMSAFDFFFSEPYGAHASFGRGLYDVMHLHQHVPFDSFKKWCELATLSHDLGKCGGEFQAMLWGMEHGYRKVAASPGKRPIKEQMGTQVRHRQAYRHEFLSAVLLYHHAEIRSWFLREAGTEKGLGYVISGAFGHHIKADFATAIRDDAFLPGYSPLPVFIAAMSKNLDVIVRQRGLPSFPQAADWTETHPMLQNQGALKDALRDMLDNTSAFGEDDPVSSAIKWVVILSDTFGSISQNEKEKIADARIRIYSSLRKLFAPARTNFARRIVARLYSTGAEKALPGTAARAAGSSDLSSADVEDLLQHGLRPLQKACRVSGGEDIVVTASTGGGKTVAGLAWADPSLRLVFTTPTTDTATRIYFDYADGTEDTVRHSRSWMDLPRTTATPEDTRAETSEEQEAWNDAMATLQGFDGFSAGITFTTADQVLGVMAYYRKSVMWLLYLVSAQVVFDEFHAYDATTYGWYIRFLEWFPGLRTAHMSATVPEYVQQRLESTLSSTGKSVVKVSDPAGAGTARSAPRFRIHVIPEDMALSMFVPRSLWLTNTVQRCQAAGSSSPEAIVYHSRFRYVDRRRIRDDVILAFRDGDRQQSVISTQVAEMSLDISAFRLITEVCPPASFIQRLGRVNRDAIPSRVADVYVYLPTMSHGLPYSTERHPDAFGAEYARWLSFAQSFSGVDISQDDLERGFQDFYRNPINRSRTRTAHTDKLRTFRRELRQGSVTVPCLLQSDLSLEPGMSKKRVAWQSVPAILGEEDRDSMTAPANSGPATVYEHHFILDDRGPNWTYDHHLGLMKNLS